MHVLCKSCTCILVMWNVQIRVVLSLDYRKAEERNGVMGWIFLQGVG